MVELYLWDRCPFCNKVLQAAADMGLKEGSDFQVIDGAPNTPGRMTVERRGGKGMVPFLIDGDRVMYESDDIIAYLRENYA